MASGKFGKIQARSVRSQGALREAIIGNLYGADHRGRGGRRAKKISRRNQGHGSESPCDHEEPGPAAPWRRGSQRNHTCRFARNDCGRWLRHAGCEGRLRQRFRATRDLHVRGTLQVLKLGTHLSCRLVSTVGILLQRLLNQGLQPSRGAGRELQRPFRVAVQEGIRRGSRRLAAKRQLPGGHLVEHDTERAQIATMVQWLAQRLFRRHVGHGPERRPRAGEMLCSLSCQSLSIVASLRLRSRNQLGEAEVEDLGMTALGYKEISRLNVAMYYAMA